MNWECDECKHIHRTNPRSCSNCSHTVFSPVQAEPDKGEKLGTVVKIILALIILVVAVGGVAYVTIVSAEEPAEELNQVQVEYQIHQNVNAEREAQNLEPLEFDTDLRDIARGYSKQMVHENFFGHYDARGHSFKDRYDAVGYNCSIPLNETHNLQGGENLAQSHYDKPVKTAQGTEETYTTIDELANGVVSDWMDSPEHRENILTSEWETEGIGVYVTEDASVYVTQNFC